MGVVMTGGCYLEDEKWEKRDRTKEERQSKAAAVIQEGGKTDANAM
jgi:hypothetical protein